MDTSIWKKHFAWKNQTVMHNNRKQNIRFCFYYVLVTDDRPETKILTKLDILEYDLKENSGNNI